MARLIFSFHFESWKGGERRGESKRKDQPHILTLLFRGEVGSPRTVEGEGALTPCLSNPGQALGCTLVWVCCHPALRLYGRESWEWTSALTPVSAGPPRWHTAASLGRLHFHSQRAAHRVFPQIFKLLDSRASPGHPWPLLFHMITAANFTFLNYEEGIVGTLMPVGVIVITISEPVLFFLSSLALSLRSCILYPFFHAFKVCQILEARQSLVAWARLCHLSSRCGRRFSGGTSLLC